MLEFLRVDLAGGQPPRQNLLGRLPPLLIAAQASMATAMTADTGHPHPDPQKP